MGCELHRKYYWWVEGPVIGLLCVVGLVANSLALLVWRSSRKHVHHVHSHSLLLLEALAVTDNFYLLIALFVLPVRVLWQDTHNVFEEISPLTVYLLNTAQSLCILMIVLVTAERYIYVCHPFKASQTMRRAMKYWLVGLVYAFSFLYNLPNMGCYCVVPLEKGYDNTTFNYAMVPRPGVNRHLLVHVYERGSRFVLMFLLPLLALAVMSRSLVRVIRSATRPEPMVPVCDMEHADLGGQCMQCENMGSDSGRRYQLDENVSKPDHPSRNNPDQHVTNNHSAQNNLPRCHFTLYTPNRISETQSYGTERKITSLLTVIVFVFMVCQSVEMIYFFIDYLAADLLQSDFCTRAIVDMIAPISHLSLVVNSSANFFVYFLFGNQFRKRCCGMLGLRHY